MRALTILAAGMVSGAVIGAAAMRWFAPPLAPRVARDGTRADDLGAQRLAGGSAGAPAPATLPDAQRNDAAVTAAQRFAPREAVGIAGEGRIEGRITTLDGAPVAGVLVRATRRPAGTTHVGKSRLARGAPPVESLESALERAADAWRDRNGRTVEASTGPDGRYELRALPRGFWRLDAWYDGSYVEPARGSAMAIEPDAVVDFFATPAARIVVDVRLPDGTAAESAALHVTTASASSRGSSIHGWARAEPEIRLPPGMHTLSATLGEHEVGPEWPVMLSSASVPVDAAAGERSTVQLRLAAVRGIEGRVVAPSGSDSRGFVRAVHVAKKSDAEALALLAKARGGETQHIDVEGEFTLIDLAPGRWLVGFSRDWQDTILAHAFVEVGDGMVKCDLVVLPADATKAVVVTVSDPEGRPVRDVEFIWDVECEDEWREHCTAGAEFDPVGEWRVRLPAAEEVDLATRWPDGVQARLLVASPRFGQLVLDVESGTRRLAVRFDAPARVRATVAGYRGSGFEGRVMLTLQRTGDDESGTGWSDSDRVHEDGTRAFPPVQPGDYELLLTLSDPHDWHGCIATFPLQLGSGDHAATIEFPPLHDVVIEVPGAAAGSIHLAHDEEMIWLHEELDASGRASFEALPAGEWTVSLNAMGDPGELGYEEGTTPTMRITVPTGGVVRFAAQPFDALMVWIYDEGTGSLAKAGFQQDDIVVTVDGKPMASRGAVQIALAEALARGEVVFVVERDGARVELRADPRQLLDPEAQGGGFAPSFR